MSSPFLPVSLCVPRTPKEAKEIDEANGNTKWQDAQALELSLGLV